MISRIYVAPKGEDIRGELSAKSFKELGLSGKIDRVHIVDSYLLDSDLSKEKLTASAQALTNPILENFFLNELPENSLKKKSGFVIEIGYLPGVTDNLAHTAKETITDLLNLKDGNLAIYTSKVFIIESYSSPITLNDAKKISSSLYNSLIERSYIVPILKVGKINLPNEIPKVVLKKKTPVLSVPLEVSDDELVKIGKEGIMDESDNENKRRGPLALDLSAMQAIRDYFHKLKRAPTDIELESLAQTWSEHCKHTIFANIIERQDGEIIKDGIYKTYIKGATNLIRKQKAMRGQQDFCVSVFSDNAGGISFDENYLITHKVETHNSPSALDPYGGAITGIVGVNRDTIGFGLGAKPVANTYGFCFGYPDENKNERKFFRDKNLTQPMMSSKRIMDGVIKGINVGGNCSGIPTLSGFIKFDDRYRAKPLVFAGTVGLIPRKLPAEGKTTRLSHIKAAKTGDYIIMVGGRVGLDGIHGATFSSVAMDANSPATAVQIGDPITQKKLSDAIVKEARDMGLYNSITDNGAGGLSSSVAEMAKECNGVEVYLDKVPLKYPGLEPWEIWISESQERMTLSVPKNKWQKFKKLMESRGVEATVIGEFTDSGKVIIEYEGKKIMDIDMEFLHNGLPRHHLQTSPVVKVRPSQVHREGRTFTNYTKTLENLLGEKNIGGFSFISEQYDHEVQAGSVLKPLSGAGRINTDTQIFRPVLNSNKGVAISSATYPAYGDISTYDMAACALDTAVRNIIASGGTLAHLAILDNFCWCSSNDQKRLGQLVEAVKACYDCAVGYGTPFISGKDSMFNDFKGYDEKGSPVAISIPPTLLISAISVMPDLYKAVSPEFKNDGDVIYLLGETNDELGAGEYYEMLAKVHPTSGTSQERNKAIGNNVPKVNLEKNLKTYLALEKAIAKELVASSISVTLGGFGVALAKACVGGMVGCKVDVKSIKNGSLASVLSIDTKLFSESQGRILISVSPKNIKAFEKIMEKISCAKIGKVEKNGKVIVKNGEHKVINTDVKKLHAIYHKFSNSQK
ncbi:phosphoribosylformylglycinamidine synthase [Candidatus Nomurabacteria bacterium]|nr:phosphoribosylformylglycinamidine synthase [Candidatus Nomurabacteria bacterium]